MADYAVLASDLGVKIMGGCCGARPIHIKAMAQAVQNRPKEAFTQERAIHLLGLAWEGVNLNKNSQETFAGRTRPKRRRNCYFKLSCLILFCCLLLFACLFLLQFRRIDAYCARK